MLRLDDMQITILWTYIALLIAGGVIGFVKAGSRASLIASLAFAVPLVLAAFGVLPSIVADVVVGFLFVFFGMKFVKGKKFMPGGFMAILSGVLLVLRFLF